MGRLRLAVLLTASVVLGLVLPASAPAAGDQPNANDDFWNMSLGVFDSNPGVITSDIAFWGNRAFVGNYNGARIYDISSPARPTRIGELACRGPQNDPTVWNTDTDPDADLMLLSVDRTQTGPNCGSVDTKHADGTAFHDDPNGWEGLRIFDVNDPAAVTQIGSVYLDCGSHTNTAYPDPSNDRLLVLNQSYPLRPGPTCGPERGQFANPPKPAEHGVIQVVEVPLSNPAAAREIAELPINYPGDPDNKFVPSEHGLSGPGLVDGLRACHDVSVFTANVNLVGAACAEQAQVWRLKETRLEDGSVARLPDTANPVWVYDQPNVDFWHSATFSWDAKYVNFIDESFGSGCPTVTPGVGQTGRMFFMNTATGSKLSEFMIRRSHKKEEPDYCSAHLGNVVPSSNRYLLVNAWYTGGVDVIDFSNPRTPREVAFADDDGDEWSGYWYEHGTTGSPVTTGPLNVFGTHGVEHVAEGGGLELKARGFEAFQADVSAQRRTLDHLNPQLQEQVFQTTPSTKKVRGTRSLRGASRSSGRVNRRAASRRLAP